VKKISKNTPKIGVLKLIIYMETKERISEAEKQVLAKTNFFLGNSHLNNKNYEEAIKCYEKSIELSPDFVLASYYFLAIIYGKIGDKSRELEYKNKVNELGYHVP